MCEINYDDKVLSLADIKARFEYLAERHKYGQPEEDADTKVWDEWEELQMLEELKHDLNWCWDQDDNRALINLDQWRNWCEEFAYDIGELQRGSVVSDCVDWEKYADAVSQDYKLVNLPEGNQFYTRA